MEKKIRLTEEIKNFKRLSGVLKESFGGGGLIKLEELIKLKPLETEVINGLQNPIKRGLIKLVDGKIESIQWYKISDNELKILFNSPMVRNAYESVTKGLSDAEISLFGTQFKKVSDAYKGETIGGGKAATGGENIVTKQVISNTVVGLRQLYPDLFKTTILGQEKYGALIDSTIKDLERRFEGKEVVDIQNEIMSTLKAVEEKLPTSKISEGQKGTIKTWLGNAGKKVLTTLNPIKFKRSGDVAIRRTLVAIIGEAAIGYTLVKLVQNDFSPSATITDIGISQGKDAYDVAKKKFQKPTTPTNNMISVTLPDGRTGQIPENQWDTFLKENPGSKRQ